MGPATANDQGPRKRQIDNRGAGKNRGDPHGSAKRTKVRAVTAIVVRPTYSIREAACG